MITKRRWLKSVLAQSEKESSLMPFSRGSSRAEQIALRCAPRRAQSGA